METISTRLKEARKTLGLSKKAFGAVIPVSADVINNIELDRLQNLDKKADLLKALCEKHNISYSWLQTGDGSMLMPMNKTEEIAKVVGEIMKQSDDSFKKRFIAMIAALEPEDWELLEKIAKKLNEPE